MIASSQASSTMQDAVNSSVTDVIVLQEDTGSLVVNRDVTIDLNGYKITIAENAKLTGAAHRAGDGLALRVYSSKPGAVYENLSTFPIFSLSHGGKGGEIEIGFNCRYLINSIRAAEGENIRITMSGPTRAITIEPVEEMEDFSYYYMILPVRMNEQR